MSLYRSRKAPTDDARRFENEKGRSLMKRHTLAMRLLLVASLLALWMSGSDVFARNGGCDFDNVCEPEWGEDCYTCEFDCALNECGDDYCDTSCYEGCDTCEADCGHCVVCGDGYCSLPYETGYNYCEDDCGPPPPEPDCGECEYGYDCGPDYECIRTCCVPPPGPGGGCARNCLTAADCCDNQWCVEGQCYELPWH